MLKVYENWLKNDERWKELVVHGIWLTLLIATLWWQA